MEADRSMTREAGMARQNIIRKHLRIKMMSFVHFMITSMQENR